MNALIFLKKYAVAFSILIAFWATYEIYDSQFWDDKRVEKYVRTNIVNGDSQQTVMRAIRACGMQYKNYSVAQKNLIYQLKDAPSKFTTTQVDSMIWADTKEGAIPTDNFNISVYFYFDKQGRLIKYDFYKTWNGL